MTEYNWILHIVDHFTKYTVAFPLRRKTSDEVAFNMALFIQSFGIPKINFVRPLSGRGRFACVYRADYTKIFLELAHDRHNHAGIDRTYQRSRQHYYMRNMAKVVKDYVQHCPACLVNKPSKFTPSELRTAMGWMNPNQSQWNSGTRPAERIARMGSRDAMRFMIICTTSAV
jgi:hypothetical protein